MKTQTTETTARPTRGSMARLGAMSLLLFAMLPALAAAAEATEAKAVDDPTDIVLWVGVAIAAMLVIKASLVACAILAGAIYPRATERSQSMLSARPIKFFVLGIVDAIAVALLLMALGALTNVAPIFGLVLVAALLVLCILLIVGLAGAYSAAGRRCTSADPETSGEIMAGGAIVETATALPILGWLGQAVVLCMALGAGLALLFGRRKAAQTSQDAIASAHPDDAPAEPGPMSNL